MHKQKHKKWLNSNQVTNIWKLPAQLEKENISEDAECSGMSAVNNKPWSFFQLKDSVLQGAECPHYSLKAKL